MAAKAKVEQKRVLNLPGIEPMEVTKDQYDVFILNSMADCLLYAEGVDTDVDGLRTAMHALGLSVEFTIQDPEKFASTQMAMLEMAFAARDAATASGDGDGEA